MPRTCSLCQREDRAEIDAAIRDGVSYRDIAGRFGTSRSVVGRHALHVLQSTADALPAIRRADGLSAQNFIEDLLRLKEKAEHWLQLAEKEKNIQAAIFIMREVRATIETLCKIALMQRELEAELNVGKQVFKDVTPGVQAIIDSMYETDEEREQREEEAEQRRSPEFSKLAEEPESGPELPEPPEPPEHRRRYRCIREHSWHGRLWAVGQVWDSLDPDGVVPPDSDDWVVFNPPELEEESTGLLPTREVR